MSQIPLSKISGLPSLETVLSEANLFQTVAPVGRSFDDHLHRANTSTAEPHRQSIADPEPLPARQAPAEDRAVSDRPLREADRESNDSLPPDEAVESAPPTTNESDTDSDEQGTSGQQDQTEAAEETHCDSQQEETAGEGAAEEGTTEDETVVDEAADNETAEAEVAHAMPAGEPVLEADISVEKKDIGEIDSAQQPTVEKTPHRGAAKQSAEDAGVEPMLRERQSTGGEQRAAKESAAGPDLPVELAAEEAAEADPDTETSEQETHQGNKKVQQTLGATQQTDVSADSQGDGKPSDQRGQSPQQQERSAGQVHVTDAEAPTSDEPVQLADSKAEPSDQEQPGEQGPDLSVEHGRRDEPRGRTADRSVDKPPPREAPSGVGATETMARTPADSGSLSIHMPDSASEQNSAATQAAAKPVPGGSASAETQPTAPIRTATDPVNQTQPTGKTTEPGQVDQARFVQRVTRAFQAMGGREGTVRLRLSPPELGSLRLEIAVRNGVMTARVEAETSTARNLLLDNLPALRDRLAQQDIKVEQFNVDLSDRSPGGLPEQMADQAKSRDRGNDNDSSRPTDDGDENTEDAQTVVTANRPGEENQLNVVI